MICLVLFDTHDVHMFPCNSMFEQVVIVESFLMLTGLRAFALSDKTWKITIRRIKTSALLRMHGPVRSAASRAFGNCLDFFCVRI